MITIRKAKDIYQAHGEIVDGTFDGRWNFSFGDYFDPQYISFGPLRVFNDDTLSPGAVWPLHYHREIEVVTYCAQGEFRHADERGKGGILKKGWAQHTTVGSGMSHSEINNSPGQPMRFIQMWFMPWKKNLKPSVEQKKVEKDERTNKLLPLVSNEDENSLKIASEARVYSSFLEKGKSLNYELKKDQGGYLYLLEGGGLSLNGSPMAEFDAGMMTGPEKLYIEAKGAAELLLVVVSLKPEARNEAIP